MKFKISYSPVIADPLDIEVDCMGRGESHLQYARLTRAHCIQLFVKFVNPIVTNRFIVSKKVPPAEIAILEDLILKLRSNQP